jgi:flagellar M-ring protein FliF
VRLRLASQGLPKGSLAGFELMETQKLGASQFLEQVNYQRALEGELARSIQSLSAVQSARVHLALTKPSAFVREQKKPSASVLLNLYPGRGVEPAQVNAIVHLVSSSVPDLSVNNVTVVDQNGNLVSSRRTSDGTTELDPNQLKYVRELEQSYAKRIEAILAPITGPDDVRAQVTADIDFSQQERAEEIFKPNQTSADVAAVRSQQTSESSNTGAGGTGGVPGAASNQPLAPPLSSQPPVPGSAQQGPAAAGAQNANAAGAPVSSRKDSVVNYEVDKTIRHVRQGVGGIRRLSVAVVVNYRKQVADGKTTQKPLAAEELTKITDLVKEAMGYNKDRGDTLNVVNSPFTVTEVPPQPEVPLWKRPETLEMAKGAGKYLLMIGALLFIVFAVLRPLLQRLTVPTVAAPPALPDATEAAVPQSKPHVPAASSYEQNLDTVRQLAVQEPKLVANVVKEWVSGDER